MRPLSLLVILGLVTLSGCAPTPEKPTTRPIKTLDELQGEWTVVEATDPDGNGFEAENLTMKVEGDKATSQDQPLRLAINADGTYIKLFATVNGSEREVGEVAAEITIEANPVQMVWMDRKNPKQVTLFQRK